MINLVIGFVIGILATVALGMYLMDEDDWKDLDDDYEEDP